jgi:tryptophan-rich sensory protein
MRTAYTNDIVKRASFILAVFVLIVVNALSNIIPFGGNTNADISAKYPTLITPKGYAFSIWGVIYLTLAVFAVWQFFKGKEVRFYKMIWPYFMINVVANCLWLVAFQNEWLIVSLALMAVILITLISIFKIFYRLKNALGTTRRFFFHVPFGLYFGWVSLAAVVNAAVAFSSFELPLFENNEGLFALIAIAVATGLALTLAITQNDYIYGFAVLWGLVAIFIKQMDEPLAMNAAKFGAIVLIAGMVFTFARDRIKVAKYGRSV